jgi:hypothetical protein
MLQDLPVGDGMVRRYNVVVELEESKFKFKPKPDRRPRSYQPPQGWLLAVEDVHLPAPAGLERELDRFYVGLVGFERAVGDEGIVYRADNVRLRFDVREPPIVNRDLRPTIIIVPSLVEMELRLMDAEIHYTRQRGIAPATDALVLMDPASNWIELTEQREVR